MRGKPRKLPMVKRENPVKRSTTCTKRRQGLFNKVAELVLFCDAMVAVFVSYPSNNQKFESLGYPSVDSVLDLALSGGGGSSNAEGEKEKRAKKVALSLFKDLKADETGAPVKKKSKKGDEDAFCWDEYSRELDEILNRDDDLKAMVDLLREIKEKAKSKLRSLGSYQHETQSAESDPDFPAEDGMWAMMASKPQFVNNAGELTYQSRELHQGEVSGSNEDEMNLQAQVIDPSGAVVVQEFDDFDVDGLFSYDQTFDQDILWELLD